MENEEKSFIGSLKINFFYHGDFFQMEMVRAAADPSVPELLSSNVIEMIMEVIKRTGKEFTEDDVEVIADASKQTGENLGKVKAKDFLL